MSGDDILPKLSQARWAAENLLNDVRKAAPNSKIVPRLEIIIDNINAAVKAVRENSHEKRGPLS